MVLCIRALFYRGDWNVCDCLLCHGIVGNYYKNKNLLKKSQKMYDVL